MSTARPRSRRAATRSPSSCSTTPSSRCVSPSATRSSAPSESFEQLGSSSRACRARASRPEPRHAAAAPSPRRRRRRRGRAPARSPRHHARRAPFSYDSRAACRADRPPAGDRTRTPGTDPSSSSSSAAHGGVVGEIVERHLAERGEMARDAGVALGARLLRECLVGDLAHDVAAELPAPALDLEHPGDDEIVDDRRSSKSCPSASANSAKARRSALGAEDRGVVEDRPLDGASWSSRAAIRARSVPGSSSDRRSSPHSAVSWASSVRNSGLPPLRSQRRPTRSVLRHVRPATASTSAAVSHSSTRRRSAA